jgi:hypothetical protein
MPAATEARSQVHLNNAHLHSTLIELAPQDWTTGFTTNRLVERLQTNPSTLKKYLRDLKQRQWAVQRDPDGLSWTYDPLLERYYPITINAVKPASIGTTPCEVDTPECFERQPPQRINSEFGFVLSHYEQREYKGGLTQSQLSRLTAIPINTLQRWKYLPDCLERIRCRTEGAFAYWYSEQNRRFYSL